MAETRRLVIIGFRVCTNDSDYLKSLEMRIGGPDLNRVVLLDIVGSGENRCEEIDVEENFSEKVEKVVINENRLYGISGITF